MPRIPRVLLWMFMTFRFTEKSHMFLNLCKGARLPTYPSLVPAFSPSSHGQGRRSPRRRATRSRNKVERTRWEWERTKLGRAPDTCLPAGRLPYGTRWQDLREGAEAEGDLPVPEATAGRGLPTLK